MSNSTTKKPVALALGVAFAASIAAAPVQADVNPFTISSLASGYMVADTKGVEGKCGGAKSAEKVSESKCGANKAQSEAAPKPLQEAKCGEAKCGSNK